VSLPRWKLSRDFILFLILWNVKCARLNYTEIMWISYKFCIYFCIYFNHPRLHRMGLYRYFKYHSCYFSYEHHTAHHEQCFFRTSYIRSHKTKAIRWRTGVFGYDAVFVSVSRLWWKWSILHYEVRGICFRIFLYF